MIRYKFLFVLIIGVLNTGEVLGQYVNEPSEEYPYGRPHEDAPDQLADFAPLIGICDCQSISRNPDGTWADTTLMEWKFTYIMDGWGIQDETLKEDGKHSGSIRQYNADSSQWYVHYYSSNFVSPTLSSWAGEKNEEGDIILYREQTAPNGMEGYYKINFLNIREEGFDWLGEWVNEDESIRYPTWKIYCNKRK